MSSFVNLMANDVWSEADIKDRLHREIRSHVTEHAETELNRALQGAALGMHQLTSAEQQSLMHFKQTTDRVAVLAVAARADAALLAETMALETAQARLAQPLLDDGSDTEARDAAQLTVDSVSAKALALYLRRNPAALDTEDDDAGGAE